MTQTIAVSLQEWMELTPTNRVELRGLASSWGADYQDLVERMGSDRALRITALAEGISIRSFSYVGTVRIGTLHITIVPKLEGLELLELMRYAYRLRDLSLFHQASYEREGGLLELLIEQLHAEAEELLSRGLHRTYARREEDLESPRGRIDFGLLALGQASPRATLPCTHFQREENTLVNQILLAGLDLAVRLTPVLELRAKVRQTAARLRDSVHPAVLGGKHDPVWVRLSRTRNRLVRQYEPALTLVRLLSCGYGADFQQDTRGATGFPGFLFDMNRFFQRLLHRFLADHLYGYDVFGEESLKNAIRYADGWNPGRSKPPRLRPDLLVRKGGKTVALLDAKYRDLWEKDLPRDMLYQLAVYALARENGNEATILYPTLADDAKESRLEILNPDFGLTPRATVFLRPVNLPFLASLVSGPDNAKKAVERRVFATKLAGLA